MTGPTYPLGADDAYYSFTCEVTATGPGGTTIATSAAVNTSLRRSRRRARRPPGRDRRVPADDPTGTPPQGSSAAAASVIALPSTRACVSRRAFAIRLRAARGERVVRAVVRVQGRPR